MMGALQQTEAQSHEVDPALGNGRNGAKAAVRRFAGEESLRFLTDTLCLFAGDKAGHMGAYLYSSSKGPDDPVQGGRLWTEFHDRAASFYMASADIVVLKQALPELGRLVTAGTPMIDLGPGSVANEVSVPVAQAIATREWHGLDRCVDYLDDAANKLKSKIPGIAVKKHMQDIFGPLNVLDLGKSAFIFFGGGTVANLPVIEQKPEFPENGYVQLLRNFRQVDAETSLLYLPFDTNQDGKKIEAGYQDPLYAKWMENLPFRIQRDLGPEGFDPTGFKYRPIWDQDRLLLAHTLTSTKDQEFRLAGYEISLPKDQILYINNSYKIPPKLMEHVAEQAGWHKEKEFHAPSPQTYSALLLRRNGHTLAT